MAGSRFHSSFFPSLFTFFILLPWLSFGQKVGNVAFWAEYPGLSSSCLQAINPQLDCDEILADLSLQKRIPTSRHLQDLCKPKCLNSLQQARKHALESCTEPNDVIRDFGKDFPATYVLDQLIYAYESSCRKDSSTSEFCPILFQQWQHQNSSQMTSEQRCSDCFLGTNQIQLSSPVKYSPKLEKDFKSLTSSCHKTGYTYPTPTPYAKVASKTGADATLTPTAEPSNCAEKHVIEPNESIGSIAREYNVSTFALVETNRLQAHGVNLPTPSTTICIPSSCPIYEVKKDDTCWDIIQENKLDVSISQLISWNPNIDRNCQNLQLLKGDHICVGAPSNVQEAVETSPTAVEVLDTPVVATRPTNAAPDTKNCGRFHVARPSEDCASLSVRFSLSLRDLKFLNPGLNKQCSNVKTGKAYCIQPAGSLSSYTEHPSYTPPPDPCHQRDPPPSCFVDIDTLPNARWLPKSVDQKTLKDPLSVREDDDSAE